MRVTNYFNLSKFWYRRDMIKIIKRGGFREQAARQLKYKDSVNQRISLDVTPVEQSGQNLVSTEVVKRDETSIAETEQIQTTQDLVQQINMPSNNKD